MPATTTRRERCGKRTKSSTRRRRSKDAKEASDKAQKWSTATSEGSTAQSKRSKLRRPKGTLQHCTYCQKHGWSTPSNPKIKDYIPIAYVKARRRKRQGRASGGISVYKHKDCTTPIRQLPQVCTEHDHGRRCKTCPPPTDVITLEIGGSEVKAERTTVTAYYCPPNQGPGGEARYFGKLTKYMEWLSLHNHRSILVGDSNGDRNLQGQPRFNKSRNNRAAEALVQLERKTGHTWMRPSNKGPCFTRYAISRERMDNEPDYDPADATSAVDHLSICPQVRREGQLMSYRLHEELHMGADHVGLQFVIRAATCIELPLSKKPRESKRKRMIKDEPPTLEYERRSRTALEKWLTAFPVRTGDLSTRTRHMNKAATKLNKTLIKAAAKVPCTRPRRRDDSRRRGKKKAKTTCSLLQATSNRAGTRQSRRSAWAEMQADAEEESNAMIDRENREWAEAMTNVKEDIQRGNWTELWKLKKAKLDKLQDMTPYSFTDDQGRHIWNRKEVMQHIKTEAHLIAEPGEDGYLGPLDKVLQEELEAAVRDHQQEADQAPAWKPEASHVKTMLNYFRRAYVGRTAAGPDGVTPDLIIFADKTIKDCLLRLLELIGDTGRTPRCWRNMRIVLAHKEGRDPESEEKLPTTLHRIAHDEGSRESTGRTR